MSTLSERIEVRGNERYYVSDPGDYYILREMYEMNVYQVSIEKGMNILDVGAHKGIFSIWAAKQGAKVVAYEPDTTTYGCLLKNIYLNQAGQEVTPRCMGVWDKEEYIPFYPNAENSIESSCFKPIGRSINPIVIQVEPLDKALKEHDEWDIVKIDAEGAEYRMLSASNELHKIKCLALEWHSPSGEKNYSELHETVEKLNKFFDVPKIDYDWHILTMRRKS